MDISVVIPLFNEEESLPELYAWIERVMQANAVISNKQVTKVHEKRFLIKSDQTKTGFQNPL